MSSPAELLAALTAAGVRDVLSDNTSRAAFSSDASLYRLVPQAVVRPHDRDEVLAALSVCRSLGVPVTARGAGTSCAGNAVSTGVVLDFSRHMNAVLELDAAEGWARVQPGIVHAALQRVALPAGWRFGPDPSSHSRCTIGGMIGNDACGSRALGYGKTSDNVLGLEVVTAGGQVLSTRHGQPRAELVANPGWATLDALVSEHLATIRTEFGRFGRQVSGYAMQRLLPEHGFDVTRFLVGSEATLAIATEATVRLVREPAHRLLVVLGYADIAAAGDAAPALLPFGPVAVEGMDKRIVDVVRARRGPGAVPDLPRGAGWLFVEIAGDDPGEVTARARQVVAGADALDGRIVEDPVAAQALWRVREDGAGLAGRSPRDRPAHAGWEDAAVPPERLGGYLREFDALLATHDLSGLPYGHFGDGCLHIRIDFPLAAPGGTARFGEFLSAAATLAASYGGSMSGEHGDGRARSGLLPAMYSPEAIGLFERVKGIFDPADLLNPGVLVRPDAPTENLRVPEARQVRTGLALKYIHDDGDFTQAVHRCTGVGKCRADNPAPGVMCPSYLATGEEKDSTRGRARVLQEMLNGSLVRGWDAPEVHDALDLCLSCKGCLSDCPTGIDMASYKSEVLHQTYKGRVRPVAHYSLGQLPKWIRLGGKAPRLARRALGIGDGVGMFKRLAGVDARRSLPDLAPRSFRSWAADNGVRTVEESAGAPDRVALMIDTFTDHFSPEVGISAVRVLRAAGVEPVIPSRDGCCGLTWISTGQLDAARKILSETIGDLDVAVAQGIPIVGLEPSCTAVYRSDARELVGDERAERVAGAVQTLAEFLWELPGWTPPDLSGVSVIAQPHCHHHAVMSWSPDAALLQAAGAQVQRLGGCCGLAGNFGVEVGHYEVSVKIAERQLLPALDAAPDAVLLADGFSCRTQARDLRDRPGIHLAQLLDPERG
ncbi:FAD-binding oxidoreductase [Calidifontibacter sp. DB0510]|uniref:FAD-binding oxidoreductase n=1 Tax=Metallococcus carri TaxID=1656884 RepID=A0A967EGH9_9MICO|nr:FAD-binding and (Fe-S)-binding domain-containing protein [Metallococcus carri]NHN55083.1 FAD-binding oxidoreductase [Metallococcus carri]NOP36160.1 FAD-binding oxidoreductase [Calidifontibacter sp. DB2511S]